MHISGSSERLALFHNLSMKARYGSGIVFKIVEKASICFFGVTESVFVKNNEGVT